nr:hypothetical protein [uncultured Campylobacter sp.]
MHKISSRNYSLKSRKFLNFANRALKFRAKISLANFQAKPTPDKISNQNLGHKFQTEIPQIPAPKSKIS